MKMDNRGQVLILVAFAILFLIGMAALAIDVGFMYTTRHELQRSADAGALAGASAFIGGEWDNNNLSSPTMVEADTRARDYASMDSVSPPIGASSPVHLDRASEVSVAFPLMNYIRVTTRRQVNLFFARVLGYPTKELTAFATARLQVIDSRLPCLKPWGIPFPWEDDGDRLYEDGEVVNDNNDKCPKDGSAPPPDVFCQGSTIILKIGTPQGKPEEQQPDIPNIQQESGHFFALDFGPLIGAGSGAHTYKELIGPEAEIIGSNDHLLQELPQLIELARTGVLDLSAVVSRTIPLEAQAINQTLEALERFSGDVRTVIVP